MRVAIIGAGAFGGWTALSLQKMGAEVTLFDQFGAGNSRSSSGDETRVIRSVYVDEIYVRMTQESLQIWKNEQKGFRNRVFHPIGVLNLLGTDDSRWLSARQIFDEKGIAYREFSKKQAAKKWPFVNFEDVRYASLDTSGGYLLARMACWEILGKVIKNGGRFEKKRAFPDRFENGKLKSLRLSDGSVFEADVFVFACGAWLGQLFPQAIGVEKVEPTRQEAFYFGLPAGSDLLEKLPVWCDFSTFFPGEMGYGIPARGSDASGRGFKIARDVIGPRLDLETEDRLPRLEELALVRKYLAHRFPEMAKMPLAESRVCQYEMTPDAHFLIDFLPSAANVVVAGGGSGHGFKMGPSVGKMIAEMILEGRSSEPLFSFSRFEKLGGRTARR